MAADPADLEPEPDLFDEQAELTAQADAILAAADEAEIDEVVEARPAVRTCVTVQSNNVRSKVNHQLTADGTSIRCRPRGVKGRIELLPEGEPVTCERCATSDARARNHQERQRQIEERRAEARRLREDRQRRQDSARSPSPSAEPPKDPRRHLEEPPVPVPYLAEYHVAPMPGAKSITTGQLVALMVAGPLDASLPVRALGRFDSSSTLGAMISEDGSLVLMSVD